MNGQKNFVFISYTDDTESLAHRLKEHLNVLDIDVEVSPFKEVSAELDGSCKGMLRDCEVFIFVFGREFLISSSSRRESTRNYLCKCEVSYARNRRPALQLITVIQDVCSVPQWIYRGNCVDFSSRDTEADGFTKAVEFLKIEIEHARKAFRRYTEPYLRLLDPLEFETIDFSDFVNEKLSDVIIRDWAEKIILDYAKDDLFPGVLLTSDPGVGKSTLLCSLSQKPQCLARYFCTRMVEGSMAADRFAETLVFQASIAVPELQRKFLGDAFIEAMQPANLSQNPARALMKGLIEPLWQIESPGEARFIIVDGLDETLRYPVRPSIVDVLSDVLSYFPKWVRFIVSSRKEDSVLSRFSMLRQFHIEASDQRNKDDISAFLRSHRFGEVAASRDVDASFAAGNFLIARLVLQGDYSPGESGAMPVSLSDWFSKAFESLKEHVDKLRPVLEILVAALEPITKQQLRRFSGIATDREIEIALHHLRSVIGERDGKVSLFHSSLREWLCEKDNNHWLHVNNLDGERKISEAILQEASFEEKPSNYGIRNGVFHLQEANRYADAISYWSWVLDDAELDERSLSSLLSMGHQLAGEPYLGKAISDVSLDLPALVSLLQSLYEVEPLRRALEEVKKPKQKDEQQEDEKRKDIVFNGLLAKSDNVTRFCVGRARDWTPVSDKVLASVPDIDEELSEWEAEAWETSFSWLDDSRTSPDFIRILALVNAPMWTGPRVVGEAMVHMLLNKYWRNERADVAYQCFMNDIRKARQVWALLSNSPWEYIQVLATDIVALAPDIYQGLTRDSSSSESPSKYIEVNAERAQSAIAQIKSLHDNVNVLQSRLERDSPFKELLEHYAQLRVHPELVREAFRSGKVSPDVENDELVETAAVLLQHPLWEIAETAASEIRYLFGRKTESLAEIVRSRIELDNWRLQYGLLELAFSLRLEQPALWEYAVEKTYMSTNGRVRSLCAENTVTSILACGDSLLFRRLESSRTLIDFWFSQSDQDCSFVLESCHRLFSTLYQRRVRIQPYLPASIPPILGETKDWYKLDRAKFLQQIELSKKNLKPRG
jgi:hypothetical protein